MNETTAPKTNRRRCLYPYACGEEWCECDPRDVDESVNADVIAAYSTPELAQAWKEGKL